MPNASPAAELSIAVLLPCHDEEATVGAVVRGFAEALPGARIYVFDNNSTDDTAREAARAGARVFRETRPGKANVVRRMFADIEADIYVMARGDGSCEPADAPSLVNVLVTEHVDMVVGTRPGLDFGPARVSRRNRFRPDRQRFGAGHGDGVGGYRALSRRFVKSFPAVSTGIDIETEMTLHASQLMIPVAEIELDHGRFSGPSTERPGFGESVLRLKDAVLLAQRTHPFAFYATVAAALWIAALCVALPILGTWQRDGSEALLPMSIIATGLFVVGFLAAGCGLILESLNRSRIEQKRILFLAVPALGTQ